MYVCECVNNEPENYVKWKFIISLLEVHPLFLVWSVWWWRNDTEKYEFEQIKDSD